ncbi:WD40-repeat-containing domain protein [Nemania sp. FL0916]|nr:WD40-repeat-containing domain protein [Nemania sp. FL0916]
MSHEAGRLRREHVLSPITALAFVALHGKQFLLAAEDTDIKVYDVVTSRLRATLCIFEAQPIHGISVPPVTEDGSSSNSGAPDSPARILIWGGNAVKVISVRAIEELVYASHKNGDGSIRSDVRRGDEAIGTALSAPEAVAPDWIFDGRISPFDNSRIVLLTAHNEVIQGRVSADQKNLVLGQVQSPSRPILYSGNFYWTEREYVLVAAGTVFGEIVVWKCHLGYKNGIDEVANNSEGDDPKERRETAGCEILYVLSGHEGSIFGVHIAPEMLTKSGENIRLLASCSDDRTIRIWDITERSYGLPNGGGGYGTKISDARQTGFGDSIIGSVGTVNSHSRCVAMAMGHISRIWQVEIRSIDSLSGGGMVEVYSFGEDATMQKWHLELNTAQKSTLSHHETFSNHSGKQIWSHAILSDRKGLLIATGGGDGKIALTELDSSHTSRNLDDITASNAVHYPRSVLEFEISPSYLIERCTHPSPENAPSISTYKHGNGKEMFQSFTFITDDQLLITTRSGRLFLGSFADKVTWRELNFPTAIQKIIQSYTILRSSRRASTAFIGAPNGELFYYYEASGDSLRSIYKAERKITDIFCLSDTLASPSHAAHGSNEELGTELLVTAFGSTKAEILRLDKHRTLIQHIEVAVPAEFIVTTAAWCHSYLTLGSRSGNIAVFSTTTDGSFCLLSIIEVKLGDKITSILPLPRCSEDSPLYFLTTARDGKYRIHEILNSMDNFEVRLLHETIPPFGPMIEGSWLFENPDGKQDLMLCGFRGKYFIVWNVTQQREVTAIDCGGGHRIFDQVQIRGNPEGLRFACTKASQMKIFSQKRAPHLPLKAGGHGREIKSLSASRQYVATAAEDTVIRIWKLDPKNQGEEEQRLQCVLALEKHNPGIQKLKWFKNQYLFSSGGNEEFFAWRVTSLDSDICPLGVVCEAVFPDRTEMGDLRITDFDVECLKENASPNNTSSQMELRFCITMSLSNSTIQSYLYSARDGFQLLGRRMYTGACLTQLRHLILTNHCYPQVLTAATDGHLAVFTDIRSTRDEAEDPADIHVMKVHQSTIKSLDMRSITTGSGTSYLIVTGGDDDAIGVLHLHSPSPEQGPSEYKTRNKFIIRSAHAAAVTGIGIVRLENGGQDAIIVTASNDQRVKTWRLVGWQSSSPKVHLLCDRYSGVADAGDLEVVCGQYGAEDADLLEGGVGDGEMMVLVAGVGIEAWTVS